VFVKHRFKSSLTREKQMQQDLRSGFDFSFGLFVNGRCWLNENVLLCLLFDGAALANDAGRVTLVCPDVGTACTTSRQSARPCRD
jgi:hypothetical protein